MIVYAFDGQGSQHAGMGESLFSSYPKEVRIADEVLGYSIAERCRSNDGKLNQTEYTQPAIFVVNDLLYRESIGRHGREPDYLLGHSLGELNALRAAGVFDFETGLRVVKKRAELMARCAEEGSMAALIGRREPLLDLVENTAGVYLAADNSPEQIVVAGARTALSAFEAEVARREMGIVVPLPVSGAFHSPLMLGARNQFAVYLQSITFNNPDRPVIANVSASPYRPEEMPSNLANLLVQPVRWVASILYLLDLGPMLFEVIGPKQILSPLIRKIIASQALTPVKAQETP